MHNVCFEIGGFWRRMLELGPSVHLAIMYWQYLSKGIGKFRVFLATIPEPTVRIGERVFAYLGTEIGSGIEVIASVLIDRITAEVGGLPQLHILPEA